MPLSSLFAKLREKKVVSIEATVSPNVTGFSVDMFPHQVKDLLVDWFWLQLRVQQGTGVRTDVVVFVNGRVQI